MEIPEHTRSLFQLDIFGFKPDIPHLKLLDLAYEPIQLVFSASLFLGHSFRGTFAFELLALSLECIALTLSFLYFGLVLLATGTVRPSGLAVLCDASMMVAPPIESPTVFGAVSLTAFVQRAAGALYTVPSR
jgi:hypothetical protein